MSNDPAPYPECMSPDGAEPCQQYTALLKRIEKLKLEAQKVIQLLQDVGEETKWRDREETDRVFAWYEFNGLRKALGKMGEQK